MSCRLKVFLAPALAVLTLFMVMAFNVPVYAVGTDSGTVIYNNTDVPDTFTAGGLFLMFSNSAGSGTRWQGANTGSASDTVADTVVQAWDLSYIADNTEDTGTPGETVTFKYLVRNIGNAAATINYDTHEFNYGTANDGVYTVWRDNGDGIFDPSVDVRITGSVTLAQDAYDTIFIAIYINPNRLSGDSYVTSCTFTDNAKVRFPAISTTGDAWETGAPISTNDDRDTQTDQVVTWVAGPIMRVKKSIISKGNDRPGDTILYEILIDNDGTDTATNIFLVDALPGQCTYVIGSAWMYDSNTTSGTCDIRFAQTLAQDTFAPPGGIDEQYARKIQFRFSDPFYKQNGADLTTTADDDGAGVRDLDSARVRFTVKIK